MITVPSQEIATFLGNHLDHVLQRTGSNFLNSVAVDREFRAGCAIMDVLNAVESVQSSLRILLEKQNGGHDQQSARQTLEVRVMSLYLLHCLYSYLPIQQNPFLCLFVDIYNLASQDDKLRSERFVTSVILNGRGEELAPRTPSELIAIAQKVESRPVNLGLLEEYLPEVPLEDQVKLGLGWDSQWQRGDKKRGWGTFVMGSHYGDHHDHHHRERPMALAASALPNGVHHDIKLNGLNSAPAAAVAKTDAKEEEEEAEDELEEWEIEAERRFQDSDDDDAPSLSSPASGHSSSSSKRLSVKPNVAAAVAAVAAAAAAAEAAAAAAEEQTVNEKSNATAEKVQSRDQGQIKRRKKMWSRK
ncbi:MAG: hypothetical protein J3Q66DRAFT_147037 [Benniella sp.]|nr:MAG: hypothetical protein J3Q66DRAFT_147037 [Benniella sp.]